MLNKNTKEILSHFKNLVLLAIADGEISEIENDILKLTRERHNINEDIQNQILNKTDNIAYTSPTSKEDKFINLFDLIDMICVDNIIDDKERILVEKLAVGLGFKKELLPRLIDYIIKYRLNGLTSREIYTKFAELKSITFI